MAEHVPCCLLAVSSVSAAAPSTTRRCEVTSWVRSTNFPSAPSAGGALASSSRSAGFPIVPRRLCNYRDGIKLGASPEHLNRGTRHA